MAEEEQGFAKGPPGPQGTSLMEPDFNQPDVLVPRYRTDDARERSLRKLDDQAAGTLEGFLIAAEEETLLGAAARTARRSPTEAQIDPNFEWTLSTWSKVVKDLHPDYHSLVAPARSLQHAYFLASDAKRQQKESEKLDLMGLEGMALRGLAAMADVGAIGVSSLVGGVGGGAASIASAAPRFLRLKRMAKLALIGGAENATIELFIKTQDPTRGADDVALSFIFGASLLGGIGAVTKPRRPWVADWGSYRNPDSPQSGGSLTFDWESYKTPTTGTPEPPAFLKERLLPGGFERWTNQRVAASASQWLNEAQFISARAARATTDGRPVTNLKSASTLDQSADALIARTTKRLLRKPLVNPRRLDPPPDELAVAIPLTSKFSTTRLLDYLPENLPARRKEARNTDSNLGPVVDELAVDMPHRSELAVTRLLDYAEDNLPAQRQAQRQKDQDSRLGNTDSRKGPVTDDLAVPLPKDLANARLLDYGEAELHLRREEATNYSDADAKEMVYRAEDALSIMLPRTKNPAIASIQKSLAAARILAERMTEAAGDTVPVMRARGRLAQAGLILARMDKGVSTPLMAPVQTLADIRDIPLKIKPGDTSKSKIRNTDRASARGAARDVAAQEKALAEEAAATADAPPAFLRERDPAVGPLTKVEVAKQQIGVPKGTYTDEQFMDDLTATIAAMERAGDDLSSATTHGLDGASVAQEYVGYSVLKARGGDNGESYTSMLAQTYGVSMGDGNGSVGAMRVDRPIEYDELSVDDKIIYDSQNYPKTSMGWLRASFSGFFGRSNDPMVRKIGQVFVQDAVGRGDFSPMTAPVSQRITHANKVVLANIRRDLIGPMHRWAEARGVSVSEVLTRSHVDEYMDTITRLIRRPPPASMDALSDIDKALHEGANVYRDAYNKAVGFGKDKGVPGYENLDTSETHVPRVMNVRNYDNIVVKHTREKVVRLVEGAILRGANGNLDTSVANSLAEAWIKGQEMGRFPGDQVSRAIQGDDMESLGAVLGSVMDKSVAEDLLVKVQKFIETEKREKGKVSSARQRIRMDETFELEGIRFEDLLENNADQLFTGYITRLHGAGFLQDGLRKFTYTHNGETIVPTWNKLRDNIMTNRSKFGISQSTAYSRQLDMDVIGKLLNGIPLEDKTISQEMMRLLRDYQFIRLGNMFGVAQVPEFGNVIGQGGLRATAQQVPELMDMFVRARSGELQNELLEELEPILAIGTERLRRDWNNNLNDYGASENVMFGKIDKYLRRGKGITADVSGLSTINTTMQRATAAIMSQKWMTMALRNGPLTKREQRRMNSIGLGPEMAERVFAAMRDPTNGAVTVDGLFGKKVKRLNIANWTDREAASHFVDAMNMTATRIVQENDIGQMNRWSVTGLGKLLLVFRTFNIAAYEKQLLHGVKHADIETFMSWSIATTLAAMAYTGRTHVESIGRSDREEFLEKRLSWESIASAAFANAGYLSLLPGAIDTALLPVGDPIFSHARSSGQPSDLITGSAPISFVNTLLNTAPKGLIQSAIRDDYDYSKPNARSLQSLTPYSNAFIVKQGYNLLNSTLPETSR